MAKYKLTYFDFSGSRGEDCRMALFLAGADFEDHRVKSADWPKLKGSTPYGSMPVLETAGKPPLAQSNAILNYLGQQYGLLPSDPWQAALHNAILVAVEELRTTIFPTSKIADEAEKKKARAELADGYIKTWAANIEKQIQGPFVAGETLTVTDLKLFTIMNWLSNGSLDHIPTDVLSPFPKLTALHQAVSAHPKIAEWRSRH